MPKIAIGAKLNLNGSTRMLDAKGLKALKWRAGGDWPNTQSGQYPHGNAGVETMPTWVSGYSTQWASWLPTGTPPTGSQPGTYYPAWTTFPNLNELEVYPTGDAMKLLGSNPYSIDGNGNFVIQPRLLTAAELATVKTTANLVGQPNMNNCKWLSGAAVTFPYSMTPPYVMGARIQLPTPFVQGMWPAIWLLRNDGAWPPEIDILEAVSPGGPLQATCTLHSNDTSNYPAGYASNIITSPGFNPASGFHDYYALVYDDYISIFYDQVCVWNFVTPSDLKGWSGYLLINYGIAGAGNQWPGPLANGTTYLPPMIVSDVVGYKMPANYGTGAAPTGPAPTGPTGPKAPESPEGLTVTAGATTVIVDAIGNKWGIDPTAVITLNGSLTQTNSVTQLVYHNHAVYQNAWSLWWYWVPSTSSWVSSTAPVITVPTGPTASTGPTGPTASTGPTGPSAIDTDLAAIVALVTTAQAGVTAANTAMATALTQLAAAIAKY